MNDKIIGVPILFFGDVDKYFSQRIKILTVGQNPSKDEFPEGFERFENFSYFINKTNLSENEADQYLLMLQNYFYNKPYLRWFSQFKWYLEQFSGSYQNGTIHIDLHSTLATSPTWGGLTAEEQNIVSQKTVFRNLFDFFNPDIILCNFNLDLLNEIITFDHRIEDTITYGKKIPRTKIIEAGRCGKQIFIGNTSGTSPFAYINKESREKFFSRLRQNYDNKP